MEGLDNLGRAPVMAVGHEDAVAEVFFECGELVLIDVKIQLQGAFVRFVQGPLEDALEKLALGNRLELGLEARFVHGFFPWLFQTALNLAQLVSFGLQALVGPPQLAGLEPVGYEHEHRSFFAPNPRAGAIHVQFPSV